jgi:hypothetical protein
MRRKITILVAAMALSLAAALPAAAAGHAAYGKQVNDSCLGASYGQLVSAAIKGDHIERPTGAKNFVESGLLAAHEGALCN